MDKHITIRFVKERDFLSLLEIENTIWTNENSPVLHFYESVEEYKEKSEGRLIFVATDENSVHGFVAVHHPTSLPSHKKQWMFGIGVHPDSQSLGIGRQLLDFLKDIAAEEGIHKISLRVMGTNTKAIQFYRKNGFVQEALFKDEFFINGAYCDDYQFAYFVD
ncbi:GNAT family N-acetyltransferase [Enterococcus plantarum]|uniref:GNAT family N-acetyltransferase n=1 Tax=Enterococcus plantarum TaxID=1077675 RepID=UPI001A8E16DB|nr:GNAT family N-acetyltransferase [Enterococcus plantarum]MBO0421927.1 GNAT family N-acetyltransferase [Enterococcus plantarum]MBO0466407.1 GNAT family N-acetyltransferase [Enterococcus plantarum]